MKKLNNISKIGLLLVLLFLLGGCGDKQEIERQAYVVALGMDKGKEESSIQITYLISNPEYASEQQGGGSSSEPPFEIISFETNDVITSRNIANTVIAKIISYDLLRTMIVSEDLAKDENFIRWMYDATKDTEIRRDNRFIVTKEKAFHFIQNNQPNLETRPHRYFDIMLKHVSQTGMVPNSLLNNYFRVTEADSDLFLSIYGTSEQTDQHTPGQVEGDFKAGEFQYQGNTNPVSFAGSAVFKEGKMIGTLTANETRIAVLLNNLLQASDILTTFPDPFHETYRIATRINKKKSSYITMDLKNGTPKISITLPLLINVLSDHSMTNYAINHDKRRKLKEFLKKRITEEIESLVKKTQEEFKADPFGWSLEARKQFRTISEYEAFDWMKTYPDMKVDVTVDIRFGEFGRQSELPKLEKVRD